MSSIRSTSTSIQSDSNFSSMKKRLSAFFESKQMSDVTFFVADLGEEAEEHPKEGEEVDLSRFTQFPGHKFLLSTASPVFKEMFTNSSTSQDEAIITNVNPSAFRSMLRYIYCEEIDIEDDQYIAVLNLADKFQLTELVDATLEKVVGTLNTSNFFEFIELWNLFDVSSALKECFDKFITVNTQWIVDQPQFLTLTRDSLALVLKQECLSISEFELFNACLKWARAQCLRAGIEPKSKKLRKALGKLFYFFRISSFDSVKQFLEAANADVFTDTEIVDCVYFLVSNSEREKSIIQKFVSLKKRGHYHSSAASDISSDNLTDAGSLRLSSLRAFSSRYRHERPKPYLLPPHKSSAHSKPYSTRYYPSEKTFSSHYYYGHDRD